VEIDKNKELHKAIHKSQHCQRNWDLSRQIPQADLETIIESITQCPSKQNKAFYKVHAITNREIIEAVHEKTVGFGAYPSKDDPSKMESKTNPQVLANLLIVFESADTDCPTHHPAGIKRDIRGDYLRDQQMAVGIAAGYCNLTSSLLGYSTGCCACFDPQAVKELLGLQNDVVLLMGVGFKDTTRGRRIHHKEDFVFPTIKKQTIQVNYIK
jgi:nitroreductase